MATSVRRTIYEKGCQSGGIKSQLVRIHLLSKPLVIAVLATSPYNCHSSGKLTENGNFERAVIIGRPKQTARARKIKLTTRNRETDTQMVNPEPPSSAAATHPPPQVGTNLQQQQVSHSEPQGLGANLVPFPSLPPSTFPLPRCQNAFPQMLVWSLLPRKPIDHKFPTPEPHFRIYI